MPPDTLGHVSVEDSFTAHVLQAKLADVDLWLVVVLIGILRVVPGLHLVVTHLKVANALGVGQTTQVILLQTHTTRPR